MHLQTVHHGAITVEVFLMINEKRKEKRKQQLCDSWQLHVLYKFFLDESILSRIVDTLTFSRKSIEDVTTIIFSLIPFGSVRVRSDVGRSIHQETHTFSTIAPSTSSSGSMFRRTRASELARRRTNGVLSTVSRRRMQTDHE